MPISVGMVSLGCVKNQIDAEMMMATLKNAGFELRDDAALADVAIVNTCGFIDDLFGNQVELEHLQVLVGHDERDVVCLLYTSRCV